MSHITDEQRCIIQRMKKAGRQQKQIAEAIGKSASAVSRELRRNCDGRSGEYNADLAARKSAQRKRDKPKAVRFTAAMRAGVERQLTQKFSPEQIVGLAEREGRDMVSHERIYQHVWQDKKRGGTLHEHLRTRGKRYRKRGAAKDSRGIIVGRVDIEQRPAVVEQRKRFGDLEMDTIIGKGHQGAILTINDRATGMLRMRKLPRKEAGAVAQAAIELLRPWKFHLHTATSDNGKEFADHQRIADKLGLDFFFAKPYRSWERGSNENLNGLIRQYIPKRTDFNTLTDEFVQQVQDQLNRRPRKRFNFDTPINQFNRLTR
ncbi:MAG TPA: IS30 family transposase [Flavobacteriales bacterium]|jgi:IS30 family transposase|nr:MAG: IS30 family transposase [Flavobacteriales bacterium]HNR56660.1 IS30 family transposase [Flavobacteriales bacterium]